MMTENKMVVLFIGTRHKGTFQSDGNVVDLV